MIGYLTNILAAWGILSAIACVMFFLIWHAAMKEEHDEQDDDFTGEWRQ